jgi:hypothetical protein
MPQQVQKNKQRNKIRNLLTFLKTKLNRTTFAYSFMFSFIILTGVGVGLIFPPAGLVVAGVGCGIFGFMLGLK